MIYNVYSIFDRVTSTYGDPFFAVNDEDCKRKVAYSFRENPFKPDLVLYKLGTFDAVTGSLGHLLMPEMLCPLLDCYAEESSNE